MDTKTLLMFIKKYNEAKAINEFKEDLKKNPLQESQLQQLILGSDLDQNDKMAIWGEKDNLKKEGLIIDTIPQTFEEFSKLAEANGKYPIKASVYKQANQEQAKVLHQVELARFPDMNLQQPVSHYQYRDSRGFPQKTGEGIGVRYFDSNDENLVNQSIQKYEKAQKNLSRIVEDIKVNGSQYNQYMPTDKSE
jgi:hypothetical protein